MIAFLLAKLWMILLALLLSLGLAGGTAWLLVVSQNPASAVDQPLTDYGPAD